MLRGLSLFSKFFSFPTLASLLHIHVHVFWASFTCSTSNLVPFLTWSTTSTNCLPGLETKQPYCILAPSYTYDFMFHSKGMQPDCIGGKGEGTSPLKFPPYSLFRPKGGQKTINVFRHFHGLIPDTNYKHLECL